jgi:heme-degrading monooxygenase HmoA
MSLTKLAERAKEVTMMQEGSKSMKEQFPRDKSSSTIIHILAARFSQPNETAKFLQQAISLMREVSAGLQGFLEGRVFEADDGGSAIIITSWITRHAWAAAQWDQEVGRVLSEWHQSGAKIVDSMYYERATVRPQNGRDTPP